MKNFWFEMLLVGDINVGEIRSQGITVSGSVFMCRLCNLFSPSRPLLLAHCCQVHPEQVPPDNIITTLKPLDAEPVETVAESPVKRKRGRPKGSTKKFKADSTYSPEDKLEQKDKGNKTGGDPQHSSIEGESHDQILGLNCRNCRRSFSNKRQILKHICLREEEEEDGEGNGEESPGNVDRVKADSNRKHQNTVRPGLVREKEKDQNLILKDGGPATGNKKTVVSFVLAENETIPGVSKIVPLEDGSTETESAANETQPHSVVFQSHSQDPETEATILEGNAESAQELSSTSTTTETATATTTTKGAAVGRGFQEYSIKQHAANSSQSKMKIFTCEFCNKIFKFRHSLVAHLRVHTQEKPFQCPHCDYASTIKANLNVHLRKHTGEKFSCQHCPFYSLSPGHLKVHIERVHMKVKQHCTFCERKYSDVKNLLKHMEINHDLKDPTVYQNYQQLRLKTRQGLRQLLFHCHTCNRHFKNQLERERHLLVHGPLRPFACLLCDHAATKMDALTAHVRKHLFLYVCCDCDGKFVSSQKLKSHLKESHPDVELEQAFTKCINSSYYLIQPGGDMWGEEDRGDTERGVQEEDRTVERVTQKVGINGVGEEELPGVEVEQLEAAEQEDIKAQGESAEHVQVTEEEAGKSSHEAISVENSTPTEKQDKATAGEASQSNKMESCTPAAENKDGHEDRNQENAHAATSTHTTSSPGNANLPDVCDNTHSSSAPPPPQDQTPHPQKESEVFPQSAFEQVFSSLRKTCLNMETFQRLRKVYGDLECQYCGKLFWYNVHYNIHVRTHTKEHLHYCTKCNYSSITKSSLKRHQIQKHSGLLLSCSNPDCKYTTPDKYKLQAHLRTHQEQGKSVTCPVCQRSYSEHRLKQHIKTSHPDSLPVQRAEKCPYCDSYFLKNSRDFQQHIWAHQGLKPYVCGVCDYAGRSRSNLKTHMNRHNTEKRHLCDLCGKKFKSKVTLKSHRQSHTNEGKRFHCSECDFTSVSNPYLVRHMEQHAAFKPFRCAHCHYSCNLAGPLKRHYSLKHPDQKYENAGTGLPNPDALKRQGGRKCPECEFVYGTTWELNRHLKSKHSLKVVEGIWEAGETVEAQYVSVEDEEQLTEAPAVALHDNVDIQQITEFSSETHDAVTSMVAMAPGTVAVVQQLQVTDEQDLGNCGNQLMVVNAEGDLTGDQVMVVEDAQGLEALTVLTQGENTHHYIVYVEEHTVEINSQS
uniref:zinc finger protein ZFAT-like isoform X2 n=1 Tax=Solea senegalensis TaxID=28829 RepID=UPI001CD8FDD4|nr:zinc finger protein ZFAT-like isoform X2 [Solea senegalensis]